MNKIKEVAFANKNLKKAYEELEKGKFEEKKLFNFIKRAINDLKIHPFCGVRIQKDRWPEEYIKKYSIKIFLWIPLPNAWRLVYSVLRKDIEIVSLIIDYYDHKNYERKFKY